MATKPQHSGRAHSSDAALLLAHCRALQTERTTNMLIDINDDNKPLTPELIRQYRDDLRCLRVSAKRERGPARVEARRCRVMPPPGILFLEMKDMKARKITREITTTIVPSLAQRADQLFEDLLAASADEVAPIISRWSEMVEAWVAARAEHVRHQNIPSGWYTANWRARAGCPCRMVRLVKTETGGN
jgi:hypothetical protein